MATIGKPSEGSGPRNGSPWLIGGAVVVLVVAAATVYLFFFRSQPLDTAPIERQLEESPGELLLTLPFDSIERVECPDDVEVEEGGRFSCTVYGPRGRSTVIDLVQQDEEGNVEIVFNE